MTKQRLKNLRSQCIANPDLAFRIHPPKKDDGRRFILRDRDGDYVKAVQSTGLETVKLFFTFTKEKDKARKFTDLDLFWKQATNPVGIAFLSGFAGGSVIEV